jgi:predicted MFS family arabinose efflux permease
MSLTFSPYERWRSFPRTIKLFYGTDILFAFAQAITATLFNLHLLEIGYTAAHIGRLQSTTAYLVAAIAIPIGLMGDRWGRRGLYLTGSMLMSLPYLLVPWLTNYPLLLIANLVITLGMALMYVNEPAIFAGEVPTEMRAPAFSFLMVNFFLWNTVGIQLAGLLTTWVPAGHLGKYEWPLVIAGLLGLISALMRSRLRFRAQPPASIAARSIKPSRTTVLIGLMSLLVGGFFAVTGLLTVVLRQRLHLEDKPLATVLVAAGVLGWLGSLAVPWIVRRFGERRGYAIVMGVQAVALLGLGFSASAAPFLTSFGFRAVMGNMQMALSASFVMGVVPAAERATGNSYAMVGRNLGMAMMAGLYGSAIAQGNFWLPFSIAAGCSVCAALFVDRAFRHLPTVEQEHPGA